MDQPFDLVFYVAEGDDKGKFKHRPYQKDERTIDKPDDYNELPLRHPWGDAEQPRPIILKLFGTWENPWENKFVATEEQLNFLLYNLTQNLPTSLMSILQKKNNILFMGYSPSDIGLHNIVRCLWQEKRIKTKSLLIHQANPGYLEEEIWGTRNVDLIKIPSSQKDFVNQLKEGIKDKFKSLPKGDLNDI